MKPILFNTEMVRALLENRKTVTRRVVKNVSAVWEFLGIEERPCELRTKANGTKYPKDPDWPHAVFSAGDGFYDYMMRKAPYRPSEILYVRETWGDYSECRPGGAGYYLYRADYPDGVKTDTSWDGVVYDLPRWHPSIHMPREAARIFLRVTDVKVQRVQDITEEEARKEGMKKMYPYTEPETGETVYAYSEAGTYIAGFACIWNNCYAKPRPVKVEGVLHHYESYPWEDIQETKTYRGKPWYVIGNPWVFANEFERCSKPEGGGGDA